MKKTRFEWLLGAFLMTVIIIIPILIFLPGKSQSLPSPWNHIVETHPHLDHSAFFTEPFERPQDVTLACLKCHEDAAKNIMETAHWKWESDEVKIPGHDNLMKIGKKNLINNFCISIDGNWATCTSCHVGYGWGDNNYDFTKQENVDCLICHDWTGNYSKGAKGLPQKGVDLLTIARGIGYPRRENCGICHIYGGGGMGVKHGDLDQTLIHPSENVDVHMGKHNLLCIDCHKTENHNIKGKAYSVSVTHENGILCTDCHADVPHLDRRINTHLDSVACQTCHISTFAKRAPTKIAWDWSKAGDPNRKEDEHTYLKIKGEFIYAENIIPEYYWFNLVSKRYIIGDKIDPSMVTLLNEPMGNIGDPLAKIWPFKVHRAKQIYDKKYNYLLLPVLSGPGGFWHDFDWDKASRLGAQYSNLKYSGSYGFTHTSMYWPVSHMVTPKEHALLCCDCHSREENARVRLDWKALGYSGDPADTGGRRENDLIQAKTE